MTLRGWDLDLKYALRALWSRPGTTLTIIATIALAVGATTAVYSVVDGVQLRPLPYPEPHRLARIYKTSAEFKERFGLERFNPHAPMLFRWLEADTGFESLGAFIDAPFVSRGAEADELLKGQIATSGFFDVLGVQPLVGRTLQPNDDLPEAPPVVVLSEMLWRERFGGSVDALGTGLVLDGESHAIVGVMPAGFEGPPDPDSV